LAIGAITVPETAVSIVAHLIRHRRQNRPRLVEGSFAISDLRS